MIRILLVDDHAVVRRGVRDILTESLGKVAFGEAAKPSEALEKLVVEDWDVVVLDISLPGRGGLDALREMKRLRPAVPVLVLSMHAEDHYALRALRAGAAGYVNKDSAAEDLSGAVRKVLAGGTHVSVRLAETLANYLEGYRVAARTLALAIGQPLSLKDFYKRALAAGNRMFFAGEILRREAVTKPILQNALLAFADQRVVNLHSERVTLVEAHATQAAIDALEGRIARYLQGVRL